MMDEKEAIQDSIKSRKDSIRFFSNSCKQKRDVWVVREFLRNLRLTFSDHELQSVKHDPPDIVFRSASFEIKEVDKEGRKRHDEYKQKLKKAESTNVYRDLMTPYEFKEITLSEVMNRIDAKLEELNYEPTFSTKIDMLFYINYSLVGQDCRIIHKENIRERLKKYRSVSMIMNNNISCVFWATNDAPEFLRMNVDKMLVRRRIYAD